MFEKYFSKKVYFDLLIVFGIAQALGLLIGALFLFNGVVAVENPSDASNALQLFGGIIVSTVLILLAIKFLKGGLLFRGLESLLIFSSYSILASLIGFGDLASLIIGLGLVLARFVFAEWLLPLMLVASVIVGSLLGASLDFLVVVLFSVILAAYDYSAVFFTKHMITLAEGLQERKAGFMIELTRKDESVNVRTKSKRPLTGLNLGESVKLGTGDVVIPLVVTVSALRSFGLAAALFSLVGSLAGMFVLLSVLSKKKGYLPGLPPLVGGALFGVCVFWVGKIVTGF